MRVRERANLESTASGLLIQWINNDSTVLSLKARLEIGRRNNVISCVSFKCPETDKPARLIRSLNRLVMGRLKLQQSTIAFAAGQESGPAVNLQTRRRSYTVNPLQICHCPLCNFHFAHSSNSPRAISQASSRVCMQ